MEAEMEAPGFWDDPEYSNRRMKELKSLKELVETCDRLKTQFEDIGDLIEMGYEDEDPQMAEDIRKELDEFIETLEELRIGTLLDGEYDKDNAILKSPSSISTSKSSSISGITSKDTKEVCLFPCALKGEIRTSL